MVLENKRENGLNIHKNSCIGFVLVSVLVTLQTMETWCLFLPCVNCHELHVTLPQNRVNQTENVLAVKRALCTETCDCPSAFPQCQDGVPVVMDGCGCCPVCARQQGDLCNMIQVCDTTRKLQCIYFEPFSTTGICRLRRGQGCHVGNSSYRDGETFKLDCRTQCTCQNGTYGCVSLCPHENVRPSSRCRQPRLVDVKRESDSCCREWFCESTLWEDRENHCQHYRSDWTPCSRSCDVGVSTRISNDNPECQLKNETRICLLRPCSFVASQEHRVRSLSGHHVRKNHQCRATVRSMEPVRLIDGSNCSSVDTYQVKYCGVCTSNRCCNPKIITTKKLQFYCIDEDGPNIVQKDFLWIIKCNCIAQC